KGVDGLLDEPVGCAADARGGIADARAQVFVDLDPQGGRAHVFLPAEEVAARPPAPVRPYSCTGATRYWRNAARVAPCRGARSGRRSAPTGPGCKAACSTSP